MFAIDRCREFVFIVGLLVMYSTLIVASLRIINIYCVYSRCCSSFTWRRQWFKSLLSRLWTV